MTAVETKFKICLFIQDVGRVGGAQKSIIALANYLVSKEYEVLLVTLEGKDVVPYFPLLDSVKYVKLNSGVASKVYVTRITSFFKRILKIRQIITEERPAVVISYADLMNLRVLLATWGLKVPVIVSERTDPRQRKLNWFKTWLRGYLYPYSNYVITQTQRAKEYFHPNLLRRIKVIPNAIECLDKRCFIKNKLDRKYRIITVGRLIPSKRFDRLIQSFVKLSTLFPDWELVIVGEGEQRLVLNQLVHKYHLMNKVLFMGQVKDVYSELLSADIFAFPSQYEGFPNALAEALVAGLPVVGYAEVSGVEELIVDGWNGFLVDNKDNIEDFIQVLVKLMKDPDKRLQFGKNSLKHIQQWAPDNVYPQWDQLIKGCLNE